MNAAASIDVIQQRTDSCQGLVRSIALSIFEKLGRIYELDDLIASGLLGLTQAARDFDPERGNQFSTYAYYRIRGEIYDGVARMGMKQWREVREDALWNDVAHEETAGSAGEGASTAHEARWFQGLAEEMATSSLLGDASEEVADRRTEAPWSRMCRDEIAGKLNELLHQLPEDARQLVHMAYFEGLSLNDAGERLGISRSWASRLHAKALQILGRQLKLAGIAE